MSSKPEREANLFMAELLVKDDNMMKLMKMGYCYEFIVVKLGFLCKLWILRDRYWEKKGFDKRLES